MGKHRQVIGTSGRVICSYENELKAKKEIRNHTEMINKWLEAQDRGEGNQETWDRLHKEYGF